MAATGFFALRFTAGRFKGGEFPLRPNREVVIGRGSEYDMVLDEDMVSRRHAKIATMHGQIVLQDLKSTNGTFVNGERITLTRLKLGDKVLIGTSIMEVVEVDRSQPGVTATRELPPAQVPIGGGPWPGAGEPVGRQAGGVSIAVRPSGDIARTEAAMPVLRLGPPPVPAPGPGPGVASAPVVQRSTIIPPGPPKAIVPSQPPASIPPVGPAPVAPGPRVDASPGPAPQPPSRDASQGLSGRFPDDDVGLPELVELFHINRRTGVLVITATEGAIARLSFRDGKLYHATIRPPRQAQPLSVDSTKAVYRVLTWKSGDFRFDTRTPLAQTDAEIGLPTRELLIEGLRQWDELRKYEAHLPAIDQQLVLAQPLEARLSALSAEALDTLQLVLNHRTVAGALDHSGASDLETWQDLLYLLQNGYIQVG